MKLQLKNKSQHDRRFSPSVHISPDSRSSELERRSRSYDRDLSRSLPLALSTGGVVSLFSQSLWSALSSRHFSWDGEPSRSRVWDDLSQKGKKNNKYKKKSAPAGFKVKRHRFFRQNVSRLEGTSSSYVDENGSASGASPCAGVSSLALDPVHRLLLWSEKNGVALNDGRMNCGHPWQNKKTGFVR